MGTTGCYTGVDGGRFGSGGSGIDQNGTDGDGDSDGDDDTVPADYEPAPVALRLLLSHQYTSTIRGLLGDAAADAGDPPADTALNGFSAIGAAQLALGDAEIDRYERSARDVAAAAMTNTARIDELTDCTPAGTLDEDCHRHFVETFGRLAFRRPLETIESDQYTAVAEGAARDVGSFEAGTEAVIAAMLQSPLFLYQVETGEPDPDNEGRRLLTGYEMATRLAFFVTGRGPDSDLLDLAEDGELDKSAGVRRAAEELVERTEARAALDNFATELLRLRELDSLPKDAAIFPAYSPDLAVAMREETLRLIEYIAWDKDEDFREIFDADFTFVNDALAAHYGLDGTFGTELEQVDYPSGWNRGGIMGHAGILSVLAHVGSTSPTLRGKFVRETLLCQTIPAPPPDVVTDLPPVENGTMRDRLEQHMSEASCAGCHVQMDNIGFGLESYDGVGAFRTEDNGLPINDRTDLDGDRFAGAGELGALLRKRVEAKDCLILNLYRHATGHLETDSEVDELVDVRKAFAADGHRFRTVLVELVSSPAFRVVGEPL